MIKFIRSFSYAVNGIKASLHKQVNLKVQLVTAACIIATGFYFRITSVEWCIVLLTIALVLCLEMVNTAIESLVNLVTTEWKPLAGKVKDIAAGAVLVASVFAIFIGFIIFFKYLSLK
ncbi:diacylglycerol kinase family protein [Chryseosolibacter indicus]|uniref:Diacylglycerol kinase family protein n=1 Tax=Chryseosolibacter indicus TaxID=2782351 RepID=A0ABS5VVQ3_9BACT|nr:diacylglycerol kinase family protein [Chryseosolibacter indicus]MBT1705504.1 diacylglycerol kinase family protein [Chryseosolibacter indicus]